MCNYSLPLVPSVQCFITKEVFLHRRSSPDLEKCLRQKPLLITQHKKKKLSVEQPPPSHPLCKASLDNMEQTPPL